MSENILHKIFVAIVLLLAIEYLPLPAGLSIYKIIILPLSVIGFFDLLIVKKKIHVSYSNVFLFSITIWTTMQAILNKNMVLAGTYLGLLIFILFIASYLYEFPTAYQKLKKIMVWYSLPHEIIFVLCVFGVLSFSNYSVGFSQRFIGLHRDPNLMLIFVSVGAISKYLIVMESTQKKALRLSYVAMIVLDTLIIVYSQSRGGVICFVSIFVLLTVAKLSSSIAKISFIVLMTALSTGLISYTIELKGYSGSYDSSLDNFLARFNSEDFESGSGRTELWGNYLYEVGQSGLLLSTSVDLKEKYKIESHNSLIDSLVVMGGGVGSFFVAALLFFMTVAIFQIFLNVRQYGILSIFVLTIMQLLFLSMLGDKFTWVCIVGLFNHANFNFVKKNILARR